MNKSFVVRLVLFLASTSVTNSYAAHAHEPAQSEAKIARQRGIEKFYKAQQLANNANGLEVWLGCYDVEIVLHDAQIGALVGTGIGAIVGVSVASAGLITGPVAAAPLIGCPVGGAFIGSCVGMAIGFYRGKNLAKVTLANSKAYNKYLKSLDQKQYEIYQKYITNFEIKMREQNILHNDQMLPFCVRPEDEDNILCSLTATLPETPVRCPNGHLYNKKDIEAWLDKNWEQIGLLEAKENLTKSEQEHLTSLKWCPFRCPLYKKEELRYDWEFAAKTSVLLKEQVEELKKNSRLNPFVIEALEKLVKRYDVNSAESVDKIIARLACDAARIGANEEQIKEIIKEFQKRHRIKFQKK